MLDQQSAMQTYENEIRTHEQRISHLEADCAEFESQARQKDLELRDSNDMANNYQTLNEKLNEDLKQLEKQKKDDKEGLEDKQST